jgi:putative ABC transport system substrate-binding protein
MKRTRKHRIETVMKFLAFAFLLSFVNAGQSSAADRPFRIGIVVPGDEFLPNVDGLKQGMKELGYIDGGDVQYLLENSAGDKAKLIEATKKQLVEKVTLIFTVTNTALAVIGPLTKPSKTPVVFGSAAGPVESGIVPAYATPGAHITGVTSGSIELTEKRLDILREILPKLKKIALFTDLNAESSIAAAVVARKAAARLGFILVERQINNKQEGIEVAKKLTPKDADVLFLLPGLANTSAVGELAAVAQSKRMPFVAYQFEHARDHGALLSYGSSYFLQGKQAARMVGLILKGTPVYQLPIERPEKYELVLNLDTAKVIGIKFSPAILNRADGLIQKDKKS